MNILARFIAGLRWRAVAFCPWLNRIIDPPLFYKTQLGIKNVLYGNVGAQFSIATEELRPKSIVYSFGVGEDISFDLELIKKHGVNVFAFDPTPRVADFLRRQVLPERFHYYAYGIGAEDGRCHFYPPANPSHVSHSLVFCSPEAGECLEVDIRRLSTIAKELGHTRIDLLKMDIEGAEYDVIPDIIRSNVDVRQLVLEFHHRLPGQGRAKTRRAISMLNRHGYKIFNISGNYEEFSFIREVP
jgi:FkbM family methyltransferase